MVECSTRAWGVRASGWQGSVRVEAGGWWPESSAATPGLPCPVDATASGVASWLSVPGRATRLRGPDGCREPEAGMDLPAGEYLLAVDTPVETLVRFRGPARLHGARESPVRADGGVRAGRGEDGGGAGGGSGVELRFEDPVPVTVGFRDSAPTPPTVRVSRSPAGVATAVTHASAALRTLAPDRSHPARRAHPPLIAFGDPYVPESVRGATPDSGIEFVGPPAYDWLYVAAPLAYYLGATVRVAPDHDRPRLRAPGAGVDHRFSALPAFADEAAGLLRRSFLLDCLARDRDGTDLTGGDLLADLGLDAASLRARSPAERLATHLSVPAERVEPALPEWPLATYVAAEPATAPGLPHLLTRLSLVYPATASELEGETLLKRAVDEFLRGGGAPPDDPSRGSCGPATDVATVDRLDPDLRPEAATLHGWLADGAPVEAFKSTPGAYRNALAREASAGLDVAVVCNDPGMADEQCVVGEYHELGLDGGVTVHEGLSREALAAVFERRHDLVHYVGHCERDGLRCPDGHLAAADLGTVRARTFVLNACGSYHEGLELVRGGSVAGAVTLSAVLDREATTVGTTLARLLAAGYPFERALSLARGEIMMGADYAVVGDGTHSLVPEVAPPVWRVARLDSVGTPRYEVTPERAGGSLPGATRQSPFEDGRRLDGVPVSTVVNRADLVDLLTGHHGPVRYEGRLWRPVELAAALEDGPGSVVDR